MTAPYAMALALLIASAIVAVIRKEMSGQLLALWAIGAALILPHVWHP